MLKELNLLASFTYEQEFEDAIALLARGVIDVEPLISGVYKLSDAPARIAELRQSPTAVKVLFAPQTKD